MDPKISVKGLIEFVWLSLLALLKGKQILIYHLCGNKYVCIKLKGYELYNSRIFMAKTSKKKSDKDLSLPN